MDKSPDQKPQIQNLENNPRNDGVQQRRVHDNGVWEHTPNALTGQRGA